MDLNECPPARIGARAEARKAVRHSPAPAAQAPRHEPPRTHRRGARNRKLSTNMTCAMLGFVHHGFSFVRFQQMGLGGGGGE
jgi:hypothetical protein